MARFQIPDVIQFANRPDQVTAPEGVEPATFSLTIQGRQEEIARLNEIGASPDAVNNVRYFPETFDPAKPIVCAGNIGRIAKEVLEGDNNLDFSCPIEKKRSGIFAIGEDLENARTQLGEDVQDELDRAEAQINRTDEELADFRDEAREGIGSTLGDIFSALPGGRFFKFLGFAILAIVLLIIIRIIFGIFRG